MALCPQNRANAKTTTQAAAILYEDGQLNMSTKPIGKMFLNTTTIIIQSSTGPCKAICLVDDDILRSFIKKSMAEKLQLLVAGYEIVSVEAF